MSYSLCKFIECVKADFRGYGLLVLIIMLFVLLAMLGPQARLALDFDRMAIHQGQWWRLFTCHIVHLNMNHMFLNVATYVLITLLLRRGISWFIWYCNLIFCCFFVGLCLFCFDPQLLNYAGFSGALYGVIVFGLTAILLRQWE